MVYRCTPLREEAIRYVSLDSSRRVGNRTLMDTGLFSGTLDEPVTNWSHWLYARESRNDLWTGKKRSTKAADCYLCAQQATVGAALATLPRIVTEIDGIAPAHSRTY